MKAICELYSFGLYTGGLYTMKIADVDKIVEVDESKVVIGSMAESIQLMGSVFLKL